MSKLLKRSIAFSFDIWSSFCGSKTFVDRKSEEANDVLSSNFSATATRNLFSAAFLSAFMSVESTFFAYAS